MGVSIVPGATALAVLTCEECLMFYSRVWVLPEFGFDQERATGRTSPGEGDCIGGWQSSLGMASPCYGHDHKGAPVALGPGFPLVEWLWRQRLGDAKPPR